jgi:hypothetical protein
VCAKVEHVFRVLKCQFGYRKVRYRGLAKNAAQVFSLLAFANLTSLVGHLRPRDDKREKAHRASPPSSESGQNALVHGRRRPQPR